MNHSGIRYCFQLWKAKESIVFFVLLSYLSIPGALYAATGANARSTVNPNDMNLNTPPAIAGNIPQDVTERAGENAVFIVYGLKETPRTADRIKDLCANFSAMIRSIRNRFPDMQFSCTMGFGADAWSRLFRNGRNRGNSKRSKRSKAPGIRRFPRPETCFSTSGAGRWAFVSNSLPSSTKS